ncbi:MAG: hypothetical protein IKD11_01380, partial [Oscillospiraceae bacterium]|nr:hypothetical protein [Oscillospiraceae bacterium]
GVTGETLFFGGSLSFDPVTRVGAVVLTNTAGSKLLSLPSVLCGGDTVALALPEGEMPDLKTFRGVYGDMRGEGESYVGRMAMKEREVRVKATKNGTLMFGDTELIQIAPCVFADAADPEKAPILQFVLDDEGEVSAVLAADGTAYLPLSLLQQSVATALLHFLALVLSVWFLIAGIYTLIRFFWRDKDGERRVGLIFTLTLSFAALTALCVLLQILVGNRWGAMSFSSFFRAMGIMTMIFSIGGAGGLVLCFATSLTKRGGVARSARYAGLFLGLLLAASLLGLSAL